MTRLVGLNALSVCVFVCVCVCVLGGVLEHLQTQKADFQAKWERGLQNVCVRNDTHMDTYTQTHTKTQIYIHTHLCQAH